MIEFCIFLNVPANVQIWALFVMHCKNHQRESHIYMLWCNLSMFYFLTHWGRLTHICVDDLTSIGSDNGLSPGWCQAIIGTNAEILLIGPLATNFGEILIAYSAPSHYLSQCWNTVNIDDIE